MPLKVMFINAINPYREIESRYPPLGVGYLISSLRHHFDKNTFEFKVIDHNVKAEIAEFEPSIVGITFVTQNCNIAVKYAEICKGKSIPVIAGGIHISSLPFSLSSHMDIGVVGEGERTIIDIFKLFLERGKFDAEDLEKIKGIVYRTGAGDLKLTPEREKILPLDEVPLPSRDLFEIKRHSYLFSSRGCPYHCSFCASSRFWNQVRFFSAEYVVGEIRELAEKYKVNLISFYDDLMIADRARVEKIASLLRKEYSLNKIKFAINARANLLTDNMAGLLKDMNVVSVNMGLESGSEKVLRYLKGGSVSVEQNRRAIKSLKKFGIAANASFVIGSPNETKEDILKTYDFIGKNKLNHIDIYLLTPLPGTPMWGYAKERGLVDDNMNWDDLNLNFAPGARGTINLSETLTEKEIYALYRKFQRRRVYTVIKNLPRHPFRRDICSSFGRMAANLIKKGIKRQNENTIN
ncbi:MAG: radical SAM protein [Candidatus Omnitrophota bacterium]